MSLFTKLFEKDHHPYDVKGRWYKFTVSTNDDTGYFSVVKSDIPVFDEDAPAFGYEIRDNSVYVLKGYIIDYAFMTLSGSMTTENSVYIEQEIDPDIGVISTFTGEGLHGVLFDLYLNIVK